MSNQSVPCGQKTDDDADGHIKMLNYLQQMLKELEDAQGGQDEEARRAMALLQQKIEELASAKEARELSNAPSTSQPPSDIEIASTLDKLEEQLGDLEGKIAHADEHTQIILGSSTSLWLSDSSKAPDKEKSGEEWVT
ncbi:hypothetical protein WJX75_001705 [Coccomyxa subellipsoidea]|uniref:Uncharacterized protein n=1 Tax=Coccomyxa subellipsoidea TaxID=248742 RepID=A0ABR2Z1U6_9CHLO